jgi:hypothetical protein
MRTMSISICCQIFEAFISFRGSMSLLHYGLNRVEYVANRDFCHMQSLNVP